MFLVFVAIFSICVVVYKLFADLHDEKQRKVNAKVTGRSFYTNRNNCCVDVVTDVPYRIEPAKLVVTKNGSYYTDCLKVSALTGSLIQNYTQDKKEANAKARDIARTNAINNGEKYYIYEERSKWPGTTRLGETFEMALSNASIKLPQSKYIWCGINDNKLYFIYTMFVYNPNITANILLDVQSGQLTKIVDEELYTPEEISAIKREMKELNNRHKDLGSWQYVGSFQNWSDKLHVKIGE